MNATIGIHIVAAVSAMGLGIAVLAMPKGTPRHKLMGRDLGCIDGSRRDWFFQYQDT